MKVYRPKEKNFLKSFSTTNHNRDFMCIDLDYLNQIFVVDWGAKRIVVFGKK